MIGTRLAIWRATTLVLLGACAALLAWTYLRDRPSTSPQWGREQAQLEAERILSLVGGTDSCHRQCAIEVVRKTAPQVWRVQLTAPSWQDCFDVSVFDFGYSQAHGLSGVRSVRCD